MGSSETQQNALNLLHSVGYSLVKAKFCVVFPTQIKEQANLIDTLPEDIMQFHVDNAMQNVMGFKKEEEALIASRIL